MLSRLSTVELIARMEQRRREGDALACDADGTLWSGDIGIDAFSTLLEEKRIRPPALAALNDEARQLHLDPLTDPNEQALRLYQAFEAGTYPEDRAFAMMAWALAGHSAREVEAFAAEVIEKKALASRVHQELLGIVMWARRERVPLYVVSASPEWIVVPAIERLRLHVTRTLAMKPASDGETLLARVSGPLTYGRGKVAALRSALGSGRLLAAFGDSAYDLPMLVDAEIAVAVRPKVELRSRASECPQMVELAPRLGQRSGNPTA